MATYYEHAMTNYFRVKDVDAFKKDMGRFSDIILDEWQGHFKIIFGYYVPSFVYDENTEEETEIDFMLDVLAPHLQPDSIAILTSVGYEGNRYVNGYALAVNSEGTDAWVNLYQIKKMAREKFGDEVEIVDP